MTGKARGGFLRNISTTSRPWSPYKRSMHLKFKAADQKVGEDTSVGDTILKNF